MEKNKDVKEVKSEKLKREVTVVRDRTVVGRFQNFLMTCLITLAFIQVLLQGIVEPSRHLSVPCG